MLAFLALPELACQRTLSDSTINSAANASVATTNSDRADAPPFATKEPETYAAKIVFSAKYSAGAANYLVQNYFIARAAGNRRLDFELGNTKVSHLQLANGKQFVIFPAQKVYAELKTPDEKFLTNQPAEFSLEHLLHTKPLGATFQRIGAEEVLGRQTVKYRLDFGAVRNAQDVRTETTVWADENLGLPIKTEVVAIENEQPDGARSTMELQEIKTDVEPNLFDVPKDFRPITFQEAREIMKAK